MERFYPAVTIRKDCFEKKSKNDIKDILKSLSSVAKTGKKPEIKESEQQIQIWIKRKE